MQRLSTAEQRADREAAHDLAVKDWPEQQKMLLDWLTTALEGGIGYWSTCLSYHWQVIDPTSAWATIVEGDEEPDGLPLSIKLLDLEQAMNRIIGDPVSCGLTRTHRLVKLLFNLRFDLASGIPWGDCDAGSEFDAADADAVFQVAALGKVVYG